MAIIRLRATCAFRLYESLPDEAKHPHRRADFCVPRGCVYQELWARDLPRTHVQLLLIENEKCRRTSAAFLTVLVGSRGYPHYRVRAVSSQLQTMVMTKCREGPRERRGFKFLSISVMAHRRLRRVVLDVDSFADQQSVGRDRNSQRRDGEFFVTESLLSNSPLIGCAGTNSLGPDRKASRLITTPIKDAGAPSASTKTRPNPEDAARDRPLSLRAGVAG